MKRIFLSAGSQYNDSKEKQDRIAIAIKSLQWFDLPVADLPFMQGYALNEMIEQMGHNPDKIGYGIFENHFALLSMRNNYSRGKVRRATLYAIDTGVELVSVAVDEETADDILKDNPDQPPQ